VCAARQALWISPRIAILRHSTDVEKFVATTAYFLLSAAEMEPRRSWPNCHGEAGPRAKQDYCSAFSLALRAAVANAAGLQRGAALVGALRLTLTRRPRGRSAVLSERAGNGSKNASFEIREATQSRAFESPCRARAEARTARPTKN
jgi:hypothetical protein